MNEATQGIIILGAITIASALGWHTFLKNYFLAVIAATVTTAIMFQVVNYLHIGYLDPFFIIAMITTGFISLISSTIIGVPFILLRKSKNKK